MKTGFEPEFKGVRNINSSIIDEAENEYQKYMDGCREPSGSIKFEFACRRARQAAFLFIYGHMEGHFTQLAAKVFNIEVEDIPKDCNTIPKKFRFIKGLRDKSIYTVVL